MSAPRSVFDAVARQRQLRTVKRILDDPDGIFYTQLVNTIETAAELDPPDDFQPGGAA